MNRLLARCWVTPHRLYGQVVILSRVDNFAAVLKPLFKVFCGQRPAECCLCERDHVNYGQIKWLYVAFVLRRDFAVLFPVLKRGLEHQLSLVLNQLKLPLLVLAPSIDSGRYQGTDNAGYGSHCN